MLAPSWPGKNTVVQPLFDKTGTLINGSSTPGMIYDCLAPLESALVGHIAVFVAVSLAPSAALTCLSDFPVSCILVEVFEIEIDAPESTIACLIASSIASLSAF
jgi:hypothetical protein